MKAIDYIKLIFMMVYAAGVTTATFAYLFAITFKAIPADNVQNSNIILGFLTGSAFTTFLTYYFGRSQSTGTTKSDDKLPPPTEFTQTTTATRTESGTDKAGESKP